VTSSIGLPLEVILDILTKRGMVIDWKNFVETSLKTGSNRSNILYRVECAVGDVLGPKHKEEVVKRLKYIFKEIYETLH
jgi:hypothetical protein